MNMKELFEALKDEIGTTQLWDDNCEFEIDGVKYFVDLVEEEDVVDEGKYQYGAKIFDVGDEEEVFFYIRQSFTQTGSYYSYQERTFYEIEMVEKATKTIEYWRSV